MALDKGGKTVAIGDYVAIEAKAAVPEVSDEQIGCIARMVGLRETTKGTTAVGAYVSLEEGIRIKRFGFNPATATLVMKSDGTAV